MNWIIFPIIAAALWATVNHLDKYLLDKYCKNREVGGLIIFSSIIGLPVAGLIFAINPTVINIDPLTAIVITIAGSMYLLGIIPYLYALDIDETSVVAPQALMLTIFTGILGYIFLNEEITLTQAIGLAIILIGALTLSLELSNLKTIRLKSKVFALMLLSSFFIAIHIFLFKYFAIDISFWKTVFWLHIGFIFLAVFFLIFQKNYRAQFFALVKTNPLRIITINIIGEVITILGNISSYYGALFAPLAIAEGITEGIQPIFVIAIGIIITVLYPNLTKENIQLKNIIHKTTSIIVMILGLFLVLSL